ncbi:MAG: hypothetical protein J6T57_03465 [Alphaproteobacteria bacterium]|nr:hypothetical protein [Alphaproteobacteria bacterium]
MARFDNFSSENFGLSVLGHLIVLGVFVFLADVVISSVDRFVAPDRIQITMIDLSEVRVSGDKTVLYNTNTVEEKNEVKPTKLEQKLEPVAADETPQEITSTTIIDAEKTKPDDKKKNDDTKNPDDAPAPRKKTVVRVNRNIVSLDRTLTVSVVDALRVAMTRCWNIDTSRPGLDGIRAVAHLKMRQNGTVSDVWFESAARAETDATFAYVLETIRSAINVCQPLRMLPPNEYAGWREIQLTFYPTTGSVM